MKKSLFVITLVILSICMCVGCKNEPKISKVLTEIAVESLPTKTVYRVGEKLDLEGMVINGKYSDGSKSPITGYTTKPSQGDPLTSSTDVVVSYTDGSKAYDTSFPITVLSNLDDYEMVKSSEWFDKLTTGASLKRSDVTTINFAKSYSPKTTGIDLTKKKTSKVMGYVDGTNIYIVGDMILGNQDCSYMFSDESDESYFANMTNINGLEYFDTSMVTNMEGMFCECSSLTSLNLSSFDTSKVESMDSMFYECSNLTSLNLSSFKTSKVERMDSIFFGCSNLTSLDLSGFDTSNVTTMNTMFYNCSSLTGLDLSSSFKTSKVSSMNSMFYNCSSLTELNLSMFDTSMVYSMINMFRNCRSLTSINLSSFNLSSIKYYDNMFSRCGHGDKTTPPTPATTITIDVTYEDKWNIIIDTTNWRHTSKSNIYTHKTF